MDEKERDGKGGGHEGLKVLARKRSRLITCQARSSVTGSTPKSKLAFHSKSKSSTDYHMKINSEIFKE